MRILFIGDIVGRSGRAIVLERMPKLIAAWKLDLVVVNGENAAGGFGITETIYNELIDAGADCVTLGNHAWDQREALVFIERAPRLIRPANYPAGTPGRGAALIDTKNGKRALVINAMGRVFMDALDDPFAVVDRELNACALKREVDAIVLDMHCEASSEKQAMGYYCDGRASLVVGTHTHVPTADHRIMPGGTAFVTDVGMCGAFELGDRHGEGRAADPLPAQSPGRQVRAGGGRADAVRARSRDRRRHRSRPEGRRRAPRRRAGGDAAGVLGLVPSSLPGRHAAAAIYRLSKKRWMRGVTPAHDNAVP